MITVNDLNLVRNPFDTTPVPGEKIVWAGMPTIKEKIETLYRELRNSNLKKVVLNWGPFGGGKTHAAEYFSRELSYNEVNPIVTHIICNIPFEAKDSSKVFLRRIIDNLTVDYIRQELAYAIRTLGKENLVKYLVARTRSDIFPDTIVRLFDEVQSNEIIRRYIHEGLSSNDLKKVHLAKSLKSDEDFFNFGTALLSMLTACPNRRVVLWVDEMENMLYYQNKQYRTFGMMIREISERVAERLMIFLNFTLTEDDSDTIKLLIGDALWDRINTNIRFNELTPIDAKQYLKELVQAFLIDTAQPLPFDNEAFDKIINSIPAVQLIPREINKRSDKVLNYALEHDILSINGEVVSAALNEVNI